MTDAENLREIEMESLAGEGCSPYSLYCIGKTDARKEILELLCKPDWDLSNLVTWLKGNIDE